MKKLSLINFNNIVVHWYFKLIFMLYVLLLFGYYDVLPRGLYDYKVLLDNIFLKSASVVFLLSGMHLLYRNKFGYAKDASKSETILGHLSFLMLINIELVYFHAHGADAITHFSFSIDRIIAYVNWLLVLNLLILAFQIDKLYFWLVGLIGTLFVYSHYIKGTFIYFEGNHALKGHLEFWGLFAIYLFIFYLDRISGLKKFCLDKFSSKKIVKKKK